MRQDAADGDGGGVTGGVAGGVLDVVAGAVGWPADDGVPEPSNAPPLPERGVPLPDLPRSAASTGADGTVPDGDTDGAGIEGVDTGVAGVPVPGGVLEADEDGDGDCEAGGEPAATGGDPGAGECPDNWTPKTAPAAATAAIALGTAL